MNSFSIPCFQYHALLFFFYPLNCLLTANVWCTYVNGEWKSFKYAESMPRHNRTNHWVDDFNQRQRRHQPISLEEAFKTKWWPHRQFTFVLSVAETNAVNSRARARNEPAESQLDFRKQLAKQMMEIMIDAVGNVPFSPIRPRKRIRTLVRTDRRTIFLWKNSGKLGLRSPGGECLVWYATLP
jgi:hypothetical protein